MMAWPSDYASSRDRFVDDARACGATLDTYPISGKGPAGESLSVDVAGIGVDKARHVIVVSSAVHGVEGLLGSATQTELLHRLGAEGLPDGVGVVLIHAVNPWGFAHSRRVDEDNIDVNRNLFAGSAPLPATPPGYAELDALINPAGEAGLADQLKFTASMLRRLARDRSVKAMAAAIANGQHTHPRGLFYAGTAPGQASQRLQTLLRELVDKHPMITHLDVHSGLGRSGVPTLIGSSNVDTPARVAAHINSVYPYRYIADDAPGNTYNAHGTLSRWYRDAAGDTRYLYLCVEIGTVNPLAVLSALRRENRAHHYKAPESREYQSAKQALRETFVPSSKTWRNRSKSSALEIFTKTCNAAASEAESYWRTP